MNSKEWLKELDNEINEKSEAHICKCGSSCACKSGNEDNCCRVVKKI